ncbi:MerR family transcriptional regulator [Paenibacillus sp. P25]|nr:MerR family transcriptional regulator [Paenibacillus sp. P25]
MLYTVKEVSELSKVTVKTLHHYHKIGLLLPSRISEAGYRLYGEKELERLQQILFYRELDIPLENIKRLLGEEPERSLILTRQKELLLARKERLEQLIRTIERSLVHAVKGERMETKELFRGFADAEEWGQALSEQNRYLKEKYDYDMLENNPIEPEALNEEAREAVRFLKGMAGALKKGVKHSGEEVGSLIRQKHIEFLTAHGHDTTPASFAATARFFLNDDFHRGMLEAQQTGLAYYLCSAAESFAAQSG